mmetsp:Transcript_36540/g.86809  ORF Transcript_36540/g.86809 Transcript_36540/m.86809 type:complete len:452 (+) Transcript_36540:478-1833(+)
MTRFFFSARMTAPYTTAVTAPYTAMSVSDALVYQPKPSAVSGHKFRSNLYPFNASSFNPGQTIMINVPTGRRGQYLNTRMSYLRFDVANTTEDRILRPDYSISSIISRISIYHGSNLLEDIHEYGLLHSLWMDIAGDADALGTSGNVMEGVDAVPFNRNGVQIPENGKRTFCVPLLSGVIGVLMRKYLPVGAIIGDLRLEIVLAEPNTGMVQVVDDGAGDLIPPSTPTTNSWVVDRVELITETTELATDAAMMIEQANPNGYMISFDSFAHYTNNIAQGSQNVNALIPARFSSLKTLFSSMRYATTITNSAARSLSGKKNMFVTSARESRGQWYYSIGGKNMPATPVKNTTEAYAELQKALHAFGGANTTAIIRDDNWTQPDEGGTFVIAQDLEHIPHKSSVHESGVNTLAVDVYLLADFGSTAPFNIRLDTFAHHDALLVIQNGICSTRF